MSERDLQRWSQEVARDPGAPSFVPLARAYRRQGRVRAAREVVLRGLERQPEHVEAHALLALLHLEAGERQSAGDEWATVLSLDPSSFEAHRGLGFFALQQGRLGDARRHLEAALRARPEEPAVRQAMSLLDSREAARGTRGAAPDAAAGSRDPARVFEPLAGEVPFLGALVLDARGLIVAGAVSQDAADGELLAALTSTAVEEARRTAELTKVGAWRDLLVDCEGALIHVSALGGGGSLVVVTRPGTPAGWVVRTAERARRLAREFAEAGS